MSSVTMTEAQLGARLRADAKGAPKAILRAMFSAAQRGKSFIVGKSPVDRGILRNAWKVIRLSNAVELTNDQPYAGVMERGARPFKISAAGRQALEAWVLRKLVSGEMKSKSSGPTKKYKNQHGTWGARRKKTPLLEQEAKSISYAIAKKFEKVGIRGKRFVMNNLEKLAALMDSEVKRSLDKFYSRPMTGNNNG